MKIAIVGTGYVGLVTGTCFAEGGNDVTCIDQDEAKIEQLSQGRLPLHEPGLSELVLRNAAAGRLHFTTRMADGVSAAQLVFLTVGTPLNEDGTADLHELWQAVDQLATALANDAVVVIKSTVPVGTHAQVAQRLQQKSGRRCDVASNPEFFQAGAAIHDFLFPDRVVVGVRRQEVAEVLHAVYAPYLGADRPFLVMSPESAEMAKYVADAMLATKISFMNEMASLCERSEADVDDVRRGIGHDARIGFASLCPGVGFGGSCVPTDLRALATMARQLGVEPHLLDAVETVNRRQQQVLADKIMDHFAGDVQGRTIALWGLAFKPGTDDVRESPALALIDQLLAAGAKLSVHDPEAMPKVRRIHGDKLRYGTHPLDVLVAADALAINTEWGEYRNPDFSEMRKRMAHSVIFDGRNLYQPHQLATAGFTYYSIGRKTVQPLKA